MPMTWYIGDEPEDRQPPLDPADARGRWRRAMRVAMARHVVTTATSRRPLPEARIDKDRMHR